ncbi:MAG TPA: FmdB family zinc ribbon protein [Vicinamibacterales bacterium]|jgi:putative FmdB family regulatory protein|nr:FmdB family zinc ribbon protein [Vicinamibacterales bacterium]
MPLYEYECEACHQRFEKIQKYSDAPIEVCAKCGKGPVKKLLSSPAIQFKGSGWYITDYAKKSGSDAGKTGSSSSSSDSSSSSAESKPSTPASSESKKSE